MCPQITLRFPSFDFFHGLPVAGRVVVYETVFSLKVASFFQKNFQSLTEEILAFVFDILNYGGVGLMVHTHCTEPGQGQGPGNDEFLYDAMYCTHYTYN